jgi:hypothetical protein
MSSTSKTKGIGRSLLELGKGMEAEVAACAVSA